MCAIISHGDAIQVASQIAPKVSDGVSFGEVELQCVLRHILY